MRLRSPLAFCGLALCLVLPAAALAAEVTVLNDSTVGGVPSTVYANFLAGESTAAWLTSTCSGDIVAAEVYWASQVGGSPSQLEQSITLFQAGTHPAPGPVLVNQGGANAVIVGPTLVDGVMNQFRHLDPPTNAVPLRVPVAAGQTFVVALKFLNQSSGGSIFTPAPTADQDGCQPLRNAVDVIPGGWFDACPQGVAGDWVMRAVIDCQAAPVPSASGWSLAGLVTALAALGVLASRRFFRR